MIWAPPALSANGLFTETDGIMAWVGAGGLVENRTLATLHAVSDRVSNEESKHLQYKELHIKARWWHFAVNKDGPSRFASQIAGPETPHFYNASSLFWLCKL